MKNASTKALEFAIAANRLSCSSHILEGLLASVQSDETSAGLDPYIEPAARHALEDVDDLRKTILEVVKEYEVDQ